MTKIALPGLLLLSLSLYLWRFDSFQVGTYIDDARYIVLAKSIVQGREYGLINPPDQVLPTHFPFGWPLLLSPVCALTDCNFQALKLVSVFFTLASIVLIVAGWQYLGLSNQLLALAVAALYALSPMVVGHARMVMSEPAFLFFLLLALVLLRHARIDRRAGWLSAFVLGVAWVFVTYVRVIGITLVAGSVLYMLWRREWRQLAVAVVGAVSALSLILILTPVSWHNLVDVREYADLYRNPVRWEHGSVAGMTPRLTRNVSGYSLKLIRDVLVPFVGGPSAGRWLSAVGLAFLPSFASGLLLSLIAVGFVAHLADASLLPVHFFLPFYCAAILLYPWHVERFLYTILPFLFTWLLLGGWALIGMVIKAGHIGGWKRHLRVVGMGLLALLLGANLARSLRIDDSLDHVPDFRIGTTWIREHSAPSAVVLAEQPQIVYLYSRRATLPIPAVTSFAALSGDGETYLLIAPQLVWRDARELIYSVHTAATLDAVQGNKIAARMVFEDRDAMVKVFKLTQDGASP